MQQEQDVFNGLTKQYRKQIMDLRRNRNRIGLQALQDKLIAEANAKSKELGKPGFSLEQIETYTTLGGTPFLDNQYTVFGEVEEGLDIIERIQSVETDRNDRPLDDITIQIEVL